MFAVFGYILQQLHGNLTRHFFFLHSQRRLIIMEICPLISMPSSWLGCHLLSTFLASLSKRCVAICLHISFPLRISSWLELISSDPLGKFWLSIIYISNFEQLQDVSERKIRFTSNHSPKELFEKIENIVVGMGFRVQKRNGKVSIIVSYWISVLKIKRLGWKFHSMHLAHIASKLNCHNAIA